jgi:hypothetical protein
MRFLHICDDSDDGSVMTVHDIHFMDDVAHRHTLSACRTHTPSGVCPDGSVVTHCLHVPLKSLCCLPWLAVRLWEG